MWKWLSVLVAFAALDYVYARYTKAITNGLALLSSVWATGIILFTGYITISYTEDHWLLIPAAIGAFIGTYIAVKLEK